jgi:Vacuolar protein sorting-associated protein 62
MKPLQFNDLLINFTSEFLPLWSDKGSGAHKDVGLWRPSTASDALSPFFSLGDIAVDHHRNINQNKIVAVVSDANKVDGTALRPPLDYQLVWHDESTGALRNLSIWRPLPPQGYVAMGLVCGVEYDKPSPNAVRCVRADLVKPGQVGDMIWSDEGSGALNDLSAWSITPPAASAGEIYLAPGTFTGSESYAKPNLAVYSLRLALAAPLRDAPPHPVLSGYEAPTLEDATTTSQVCELPWFTVNDPALTAIAQLQTSPTYQLERTDHHVLVGFEHNPEATSRPSMWTAAKGIIGEHAKTLALETGVELGKPWPTGNHTFELSFAAHLEQAFTHSQRSVKGWSHSSPLEIIAYVTPQSAIAGYLLQSEYRLLRLDGSQVSSTVSYNNGDHVYMSQHPSVEPPPDENAVQAQAPLEVTGHDLIDETLAP